MPRPSTRSFRTNCWPTTVRHRSIGNEIWTTRPSQDFKTSWVKWVTIPVRDPCRFSRAEHGMFDLARAYNKEGMAAYSRLEEHEFELEREHGYSVIKHQRFVGAGYFDEVQMTLSGGQASTDALEGGTEEEQFSELTAAA